MTPAIEKEIEDRSRHTAATRFDVLQVAKATGAATAKLTARVVVLERSLAHATEAVERALDGEFSAFGGDDGPSMQELEVMAERSRREKAAREAKG